jgi:hypothetical protein
MNRRGFLTGIIAAPAVVLRPGLLMPLRGVSMEPCSVWRPSLLIPMGAVSLVPTLLIPSIWREAIDAAMSVGFLTGLDGKGWA